MGNGYESIWVQDFTIYDVVPEQDLHQPTELTQTFVGQVTYYG